MTDLKPDIDACIETLNKGGIILYPTDTIWGIGCDATNPQAVEKVYQLKQRNDNKALIVLLGDEDQLSHYVVDVPEMAYNLLEVAVDPLTIIYEGAYNVAPNLLGDNDSLGIRIPHETFTQKLCRQFKKPIVSTSANISGEPAAQNYRDIDPRIIEQVDYVCWSRRQEHKPHQPSAIIKLGPDGEVKVIR